MLDHYCSVDMISDQADNLQKDEFNKVSNKAKVSKVVIKIFIPELSESSSAF